MPKTVRRFLGAVGFVLTLSMLVVSCGNDDDAAPEPASTSTPAPSAAVASPTPIVELFPMTGTLQVVLDRGFLLCGSRDDLPGFAFAQPDGTHAGFDVDMCRVVAAAVLGDADALALVPVTSAERFTALAAGQFDVMNRSSTWTATRDGAEGASFPFIYYYDGQGMMVPASSGFTTLEDLVDANICVSTGTTTELNLTAVFEARGISFNPITFEGFDTLVPAYEQGQCEAMTGDTSALGVFKYEIEQKGGLEQHIMAEVFSKEPLGTVVRDGDTQWA